MDLLMTFNVPDDDEDTSLFRCVVKAIELSIDSVVVDVTFTDDFGTGFATLSHPDGTVMGTIRGMLDYTQIDIMLRDYIETDIAKIMCLTEYLIEESGEDVHLVEWRDSFTGESHDDVGLGTLGALLDMGEDAVLRWWESTIPDLLEAVDGRSSVA